MDKSKLGIKSADILLPREGIDLKKWATVACDQYTSEPEYWLDVEKIVADSPSTFRITFPEVYLEKEGKKERIRNIVKTMEDYIEEGVFTEYKDSFILVKRTCDGKSRYGLMAALDLDQYDYSKDSRSLIRATEGTILERIPPRKEIRKDAPLELPHIMVLISDEKRSVIEPLKDKMDSLKRIYSTELMKDGGYLEGYLIDSDEDKEMIYQAFESLYSALDKTNPLLFAMGDGNHSLATAKSCWEDMKKGLSEEERKDSKARYALVEIENIYDEALLFEPIHRVFFNLSMDEFEKEVLKYAKGMTYHREKSIEDMVERINGKDGLMFGLSVNNELYSLEVKGSRNFLSASLMQSVIDSLKERNACQIDYIHGIDVTVRLSNEGNNIGIILPDVDKSSFFETVIKEGSFPRKTFSIGHANEKRYYMEARRIK